MHNEEEVYVANSTLLYMYQSIFSSSAKNYFKKTNLNKDNKIHTVLKSSKIANCHITINATKYISWNTMFHSILLKY